MPDDPDGDYDFGLGAGFYVNATQAPFDKHYHMYDYMTQELPGVVADYVAAAKRAIAAGFDEPADLAKARAAMERALLRIRVAERRHREGPRKRR